MGIAAGLIVLAGLATYAQSLSAPFVFDDRIAIVENASIRSIAGAFQRTANSPLAGRPLVALSLALNHAAGGLDVWGYHLANLGIHLGTALLLFGLVRRTLLLPRLRERFGPPSASLAFAVALLWTVHPVNSEAVVYTTQRTESLMALFCLLTIYASLRALDAARPAGWQGAALVACGLGMACKESMVVAPILVLLYDGTFVFDGVRDAVRRRWRFYGGLALGWAVLAYLNIPSPRSGSAGFSAGVEPWTYLMNQAVMIVRYLRLAAWPTDLVINYGAPLPLALHDVWPQATAVGVLLVLTIVALVRWPAAGFLGAWVFLTLAPASSLIPIATEVGAERRMYLPLMALIALGVLTAYRLCAAYRPVSVRLGRTVLVVVAAVLAAATIGRIREYESPLSLARTTLARWPSVVAHGMVGTELATLGRDDEALPDLLVAAPTDPRSRYNLGITLFNRRDYAGAIRELDGLARAFPMREEIPAARRAIGSAYAAQGDWPEAARQYRLVLEMVPSDPVTRRLLVDGLISHGTALARAGRFTDAIEAFRQAVALDPSNGMALHDLAAALYDAGDLAGALTEARRAIVANGRDADSYHLVGRVLARQGRYDEAADALQRALRLNPDDADVQGDVQQVLAAQSGRSRH